MEVSHVYKPSQILTETIEEISLLIKRLSMNGFLKIKMPFFSPQKEQNNPIIVILA